MARRAIQKYHQVTHPKLLSQTRLNRWLLISCLSLNHRPFQNLLSTTQDRQTSPRKLLAERQRLLLHLKSNHPADQELRPIAPGHPKPRYVKPNRLPNKINLGHRARGSERVDPLNPAIRRRRIMKSRRRDQRETLHLQFLKRQKSQTR